MRDIWCHLSDDWYIHAMLDIRGIVHHKFRVLSHIASHSLESHLRTREVEFHCVESCILCHVGQLCPVLERLSHDACDDNLVRIVLFQTAHDVEVHFGRVLAQLFHIAETIESAIVSRFAHRVKSW